MQQNTITSIEKLQPGDLFTKKDGGFIYIVVNNEKIVKNKKIYVGTCRRVDQDRLIMFRQNIAVVFIKNLKITA